MRLPISVEQFDSLGQLAEWFTSPQVDAWIKTTATPSYLRLIGSQPMIIHWHDKPDGPLLRIRRNTDGIVWVGPPGISAYRRIDRWVSHVDTGLNADMSPIDIVRWVAGPGAPWLASIGSNRVTLQVAGIHGIIEP